MAHIGIDARLTPYRVGGISRYIRSLITAFEQLRPPQDFTILESRKTRQRLSAQFRRRKIWTPPHHRLERAALSLELWRHQLDLLHSPDFIAPLQGAKRHIITVHDLSFIHYPEYLTASSRRYYNGQIEASVKRADHILVDSEATKKDLIDILQVPARMISSHRLGVAAALGALAAVYAGALGGAVELNARAIAEASALVIVAVAAIYFLFLLLFGGLTRDERLRVLGIMVLFFGAAMFWAGFEQSGSSLNLFAERYTIREFGAFSFPAEWFQSLNPFFIIVLGPLFAMLWTALASRNRAPSTPLTFAFGLIQLGLGFLVMIGAATLVAEGNPVLPTWLFFTYLLHTTGELCLSPVGLSAVTRLAPRKYMGQMMGIWFLGASLGSLIAGLIAGEFDPEALSDMPGLYGQIVLTTVGSGLILAVFLKPLKKCMTPAEEAEK